MARNIEVKAHLENRKAVEARLAELGVESKAVIHQHDTFYHTPNGRLKLRRMADQSSELIYYQRENTTAAKESYYIRTPIPDPDSFHASLEKAYGSRGVVQKVRHLYMSGRTRVHLDSVTALGEFLELEVILSENEPNEAGAEEAKQLITALGIPESAMIAGAYIDLLTKTGETT